MEGAYAESRYGMAAATRKSLEGMMAVARELFSLLDQVEERALG
ncbi:MAG: hypothetical protein ACP5K1_04785 [Candidatus Bathyarchaeia archaeon]